MAGESDWIWWTAAAAAALGVLLIVWIWWRGRPFAAGDVFRASRLSGGNHLFPTQVQITPTSVVQYTPAWIGREEETIHMAHISSVRVQTGMLLSDVVIETSGGSDPIRCHGHWKRDADRIKSLIERHQTEYYRGGASGGPGGPIPPAPIGR